MAAGVQTAAPRIRVESVDLVRGIIMALMAIDHVRDYFGARVNPTDPATTTVALFFTRWATHFCAPVFMLTAGLNGDVEFSMREVYGGVMAPLIGRSIPDLQPAFEEFASDLKRAAEETT